MATLTETTALMRTLIKIAIGIFIFLIIAFYGFQFLRKALAPKQVPIAPTTRYGKLPYPDFPTSSFSTPSFTIETPTGNLNEVTDPYSRVATVAGLMRPRINFASREEIVRRAKSLGFISPPQQIGNATLVFTDPDYPLRKLTTTLGSDNFTITYDYEQEPSVFSASQMADETELLDEAKSALGKWSAIPDELFDGEQIVQFLSYADGQLVPVTRIQEADAARVNFYRKPLFNVPIVYPSTDKTPTSVLIGPSRDDRKKLLEVTNQYYSLASPPPLTNANDTHDPNATYPIKTVAQAFQELENGQGNIVQYDEAGSVAITEDPYLALYEDDTNLKLYPVYVFKGDSFLAYVSAVQNEWFKTTQRAGTGEGAALGISTQQLIVPNLEASPSPKIDRRSLTRPKQFSDLVGPK